MRICSVLQKLLELLLAAQVRDAGVDLTRPALDDAAATTTQRYGNAVLQEEPD